MSQENPDRPWPAYLEAYENGTLKDKVRRALAMLESCWVCLRDWVLNGLCLDSGIGQSNSVRFDLSVQRSTWNIDNRVVTFI